jgi:phage protein D/phage baseplate assembly protein gpV
VSEPYYAPRFDIRISGVFLAADVTSQVVRVKYDSDLDVASMFSIVLRNPDNKLLDSALFDLGKTVEIHMGYGNDLQPMMLGEVTSIEPSFPESGAPTLAVTGYDKSYRMRHNVPEAKQHRYVNDSLIAAQIAAENLLVPIVDPSPIGHLQKPILQTESDMAFLKERAQANFFEVRVWWDKLYFQFPRPQGSAYVLEWGKNLSSFSPRISSAGMAGLQVVRSYSEDLAQTIVAFAMAPQLDVESLVEKIGSAGIELLLSLGRRVSRVHNIESPFDASVLAKSLLLDILEGLYEGSGSCIGIPDLQAGKYIQIRGVGKRFSGTYRLRKATHTIDENGYRTSFEVTQRSGSNILGLLRKTIHELPQPNQQEKFYGVMVAKVTSNVEILDGPPAVPLGRVKVSFPGISENVESGWARCAMPMAGKNMGVYFLPEVGDEVIVGFEGGNLSKPVVLGSVWNTEQMPPASNTDTLNSVRMIKSKSGHTITLDDSPVAPKLVIKSNGGHTITCDDTKIAPKVVIQSSGGHTVTLDDSPTDPGVTVQDKLGSSVTLNAQDGSVTIDAKKSLTLKALSTITLQANDVKVQLGPTGTMDVS